MDYGQLPYTGGGLVLGSLIISQTWLLGIAVALVLMGTLLIRFGWRRGKAGNDL